jgi:hypothetical protein
MSITTANFEVRQFPTLLGGDPDALKVCAANWQIHRVLAYVAVIIAGAGLYGAAMGCWRSPVQAGYNLIKFPFVILATAFGNALLNGMLAPLLGLNLPLRQSLILVLMTFTIAAGILGSFAPILFFIIWNTPSLAGQTDISWATYHLVQLAQVGIIAFAGVAANARLTRLLRALSGDERVARRVLCAWLAGNLFLGSQLCWILRPFIGSPGLPVEFLRPTAFQGNFYETVFRALGNLLPT